MKLVPLECPQKLWLGCQHGILGLDERAETERPHGLFVAHHPLALMDECGDICGQRAGAWCRAVRLSFPSYSMSDRWLFIVQLLPGVEFEFQVPSSLPASLPHIQC